MSEPADWESADIEAVPSKAINTVTDKWDGEDEDDSVRDNWDEDEEKSETTTAAAASTVQVPKKTKNKISKIEEQKKIEQEEKRKQEREAQQATMTPEEKLAAKIQQEELQKKADLALAIDAFGGERGTGLIDSFEPSTKEDFEKFAELLCSKITRYERSPFYEGFLESLYQKLALSLDAEAVKKLSNIVTALANEKLKQQKSAKGKKKSQKATLVLEKDGDSLRDDTYYDEYDDYM